MNEENCALKLVDEIILYYDARSEKHQNFLKYSIMISYPILMCLFTLLHQLTNRNSLLFHYSYLNPNPK